MTIYKRSSQDHNVTVAEYDASWDDVDGRLNDLETNLPVPVQIESFEVVGDQFFVNMDDYTVNGPFQLPQSAARQRGYWAPSTSYVFGDTFRESNSIYSVIFTHTSELTFDPGANDGFGNDFYGTPLSLVVDKFEPVVVSTSTHTPGSGSLNRYHRCTHASGCTVTLPTSATLPATPGDEIQYKQTTAMPVSISPASGVTINPYEDHIDMTAGRGRVLVLTNVAENEWDICGGLALDPSS
jgi:hypothetical protein